MAFRGRALVGIVVGIVAAVTAPAAFAKNQIYWTNVAAHTITFANLDGTGGFGTLDTTGATVNDPEGVAIDPANGRIYWADESGGISFANLGGGGGGDLNLTGATVNSPFGLAIDATHGRIYWANSSATAGTPGISFANLDGSGGGDLNTGTATIAGPIGVAIDQAAGKIFWANWNGGTPMAGKISFAFLDGSGGGDLATAGATVTAPEGVAIDPATNRIYWANQQGNKISFANLNGIGGGDVTTTGATVSDPSGVAIDPTAGKIYWANQDTGGVSFANLDGSGGGDLDVTGSTSTNASMPALLESPLGAGKPTITGGSTASTQLGCTTGTWGPDLFRSLLYQAPQRFSFRWSEDGATISGATNSLLQATTPGSYTCTVSATNFAGSTTQTSAAFRVAAPPPPPPPATVSATAKASGLTAKVTVTCHGVSGQSCSGAIALKGSSGKGKHKKSPTVGHGSYSLAAGTSRKISVKLNSKGKTLLGQSFKLPAKVTFPGTSAKSHKVTFRIARISINHHQLVWSVTVGTFTSAFSLTVKPVPKGAKIAIACHGSGCPFGSKTVKAKKTSVSVTGLFGSAKLRPGAHVIFTITAKNHVGQVLSYALLAKPVIPTPSVKCLPPGSHRPVKC